MYRMIFTERTGSWYIIDNNIIVCWLMIIVLRVNLLNPHVQCSMLRKFGSAHSSTLIVYFSSYIQ